MGTNGDIAYQHFGCVMSDSMCAMCHNYTKCANSSATPDPLILTDSLYNCFQLLTNQLLSH